MINQNGFGHGHLNSHLHPHPHPHPSSSPEDEVDPSRNHRSKKRHFYDQILKQLEFYMGDANLSRDRFLAKKLMEDPQLPVELFLTFNKIRSFTNETRDLVIAIRKSKMLGLSEDHTRVFRTTKIQRRTNQDNCTIYVENLPTDADHEWLQSVFSKYGNVLYVSIPKYRNKNNKGFAFIEFDSPGCVSKVLEVFGAAGCRLPKTMSSEQLLSIRTFEEDGGRSLFQPARKIADLVIPEIEFKGGESSRVKRKQADDEDEGLSKRPKLAEGGSSGSDASAESNDESGDDEDRKNRLKMRKNKKGKKKQFVEVASLGLQVLSKQEWKRLRNSYLNTQRKRLSQIQTKAEPEEAEMPEGEEEKPKPTAAKYDFVSGVIIKFFYEEGVEDIKDFKLMARSQTGVEYVDIVPHRAEIYVRCSSPEVAKILLKSEKWPNMVILEGEEEAEYWEKILTDRSEKLQRKRNRDRGKADEVFKRPAPVPKKEDTTNLKLVLLMDSMYAGVPRTHIRFTDE